MFSLGWYQWKCDTYCNHNKPCTNKKSTLLNIPQIKVWLPFSYKWHWHKGILSHRGLAWLFRLPSDKRFEPVYPTAKMAWCSPFNIVIPIMNNDFIILLFPYSVWAVIILLWNALNYRIYHFIWTFSKIKIKFPILR